MAPHSSIGAPTKYNYEAPEGEGWRGLFRGLSGAPGEGTGRGLPLSSAGTVYVMYIRSVE